MDGDKRFDAKQVKEDIATWIGDYFERNGKDCNAIIGISGGKDSSVAAALCVEALGKDRVIGIKMPCGMQSDIGYANGLVDFLGIRSFEADIESPFIAVRRAFLAAAGRDISDAAAISLKPRLRMCMLYAFAQTLNGRVANTGNKSENAVGYYTRFGDGAGDFAPIANLTVSQVCAVGRACGLPDEFVEKAPSDGLCGLTDEEALGFRYGELDAFLSTGTSGNEGIDRIIASRISQSRWKQEGMPSFPL